MRHRRTILIFSLSLLMLLLVLVTSQSGEPFLYVTVRVLTDTTEPFRMYRQLQLRCDIDSSPPLALDRPDVQHVGWVLNDDLYYLANDKRFTVYKQASAGSLYSVLTIHSVTATELGTYTCEARNTAGMYRADSLRIYKGPEQIVYIEKVQQGTKVSFLDNVTMVMTSPEQADSQDETSSSPQHQTPKTSYFTFLLLFIILTS